MLELRSVRTLKGEVTVPGDKSVSHRSIMFGSLSKGDTCVTNFLNSADCSATMDCFQKLGVSIERNSEDPTSLIVHGAGLHGLKPISDPVTLNTQNSGTTTRIMSGILAPQHFTSIVAGDDSVNSRPMKRIITPLSMMGANVISMRNNNCAPLQITGTKLHSIHYDSPVASAQVKSSVICAGLYAEGTTSVTEPVKSRDHTERMLKAFGASIESEEMENGSYTASVKPADELYSPGRIVVPGDISSAAYFLAAASIVPNSEILIRNVGTNPTRDGMLRVLRAMGAEMDLVNQYDEAEPFADILVKTSTLHATTVEGDIIPALIDELPVIAVMAAAAEGTTIIKDAAELKVKESDRIAVVTENLRAMGADITPTDDGMIIQGGRPLHGALIRTYGDHRIAMSFAIASLIAEGTTILDNEKCCSVSYPTFFEEISRLSK